MNSLLARACLAAARAYIGVLPNARGVSRLMTFVEGRVVPFLPRGKHMMIRCPDGREFDVSVHDPACFNLMMMGTRDPLETEFVRRLVRPGDVVFDVGANIGWYTTLAARLVSPGGRVHAFEPVPGTIEVLRRNCDRNGALTNVALNNVGLGEAPGRFTIFVPRQHGGASLRRWGDEPMDEIECRVETLDDYCERNGVNTVRLIKCDVEGAELGVMKGAERLLRGERPPIWLLELNAGTAARFGYKPDDLLKHLAARGYAFCGFDGHGRHARLKRIAAAADVDDGANVICSVPRVHGDVAVRADADGGRGARVS